MCRAYGPDHLTVIRSISCLTLPTNVRFDPHHHHPQVAADRGDPDAMFYLAWGYYQGKGGLDKVSISVSIDVPWRELWFYIAAQPCVPVEPCMPSHAPVKV